MTHPTDYDTIAEEYRESKLIGFRSSIERYALFSLLGDLKGLRVLDLACGEGIYSREAKRRGAASVLGIDLSPEMIRLAEERERLEPTGCSYRVGDARTLDAVGRFDRVMGVYLLNYASTRDELFEMAVAVRRNLEPGGRFIGVNSNPFQAACGVDFRKYDFTMTCESPNREGAAVTWRFFNPDGSDFSIENYYLSPETHVKVFLEAGFKDFCWVGCQLDPRAPEAGSSFWDDFLSHPPVIAFEAIAGPHAAP